MLAYTYIKHGTFQMMEKPVPEIKDPRDAVVRVTLGSICTSDLHIKHGSVPRAVPGITVGHEMVGIVERVGEKVTSVKPGDRVTVNVETFCGECFFCRQGYVNNCEDEQGGWALGCRIDGGQAEYVRVPYADQGLNRIPEGVSDEQALFVGHWFLGSTYLRDFVRRYGAHYRSRSYWYMHLAVYHAETSPAYRCMRKVGRAYPLCTRALSGSNCGAPRRMCRTDTQA